MDVLLSTECRCARVVSERWSFAFDPNTCPLGISNSSEKPARDGWLPENLFPITVSDRITSSRLDSLSNSSTEPLPLSTEDLTARAVSDR
jgi:hypothetical protein